MKLTISEALNILGIKESPVTKDMIKLNHRRLLSKNHPDRNPEGHSVTQMINVARDFLYKQPEPIKVANHHNYQQSQQSSTRYVRGMFVTKQWGETIVSGDTFRFKEVLKDCRFRWSPEDKHWWRDGFYPIEEFLAEAEIY